MMPEAANPCIRRSTFALRGLLQRSNEDPRPAAVRAPFRRPDHGIGEPVEAMSGALPSAWRWHVNAAGANGWADRIAGRDPRDFRPP